LANWGGDGIDRWIPDAFADIPLRHGGHEYMPTLLGWAGLKVAPPGIVTVGRVRQGSSSLFHEDLLAGCEA